MSTVMELTNQSILSMLLRISLAHILEYFVAVANVSHSVNACASSALEQFHGYIGAYHSPHSLTRDDRTHLV